MIRLICPRCQQAYLLPDERIRVGDEIAFPCPSCKKGLIKGIREPQMDEDHADKSSEGNEEGRLRKGSKSYASANELYGSELKLCLLRNLRELPSMPQIMIKAQMIMRDPRSSLKDLAALVKSDQAIVAKALRLANSAYYGLAGKVAYIEHATVLLGSEAFCQVVAMAASSNLLGAALKGYDADPGALWRHSLAVAFGSKIIADKRHPDLANTAFTAGIIHDAGKLILDKAVFERKERFDDFLSNGQQTFLDAEKEILGFDHAEIASDVCRKWRIPESVAIPIRFHHSPSSSQGNELAYVLHIADCIAMVSDIATGVNDTRYRVDDTAKDFLGINDEDISDIRTQVLQSVENVEREIR
jgi:HD-like signal output (HDOD) protein